jgi:hypothetical protein
MLKRFDKWHKTKSGLLVSGLIELAITYGFISLAIDRGNLWWYLLTLVFFVGALQNLIKLIGVIFNGRRSKR